MGTFFSELFLVKKKKFCPLKKVLVLGVPINYPGTDTQSTKAWTTATEKLHATLERVTGLTDAQTAHHLLRKCLDGCRVNHLLRASDPYTCTEQVNTCDVAILTAFEDIVSHGLDTNQKAQASMPLATGGCGIRIPSVIRPAARISALATFYTTGRHAVAAPIQDLAPTNTWVGTTLQELNTLLGANFDPLTTWTGDHNKLCRADAKHMQQKWWSAALGKQRMTRLLDTSTPRDQAQLL
jgi:hypothetical protein